jgi:hypothetical protein
MKYPRIAMTRRGLVASTAIIAAATGLFELYANRATHSKHSGASAGGPIGSIAPAPSGAVAVRFERRAIEDTGGFYATLALLGPWSPDASLEEIAKSWDRPGLKAISALEGGSAKAADARNDIKRMITKATLFIAEGEIGRSYEILAEARSQLGSDTPLARKWLFTIIYLQGVTAMRRGENENCIDCRGESSCILPIAPTAVHTNPTGSRLAIRHFTEYLEQFPDDLGVCWLLNLAHMTLGEHPDKVDSRFRLSLGRFRDSEFDIGKFRDIGHLAGVNRFNQAGGAIMEDFDGDGLLDIAVTSVDPTQPMAFYRNRGDGTFDDRSREAGLTGQLGGLVCYQTDYNNDGRMDIFVPRGAWLPYPIRPSLLRNNGDGTFADVTKEAGLAAPVNSNAAAWSDYDNDGWLDLFIACERQHNRLYHNRKDGTFEEVSARAGLSHPAAPLGFCKGTTWVDFDNDDYPDLFLNNLKGSGELFHNERDGTFRDVAIRMRIDGPRVGFSCWSWDYDNDGWLDIFAAGSDHTLDSLVRGMLGQRHNGHSGALFRNVNGRSFENAIAAAGLDMAFAPMGSNYGDFDNDGFLDFYLGTGDPEVSTLVPNRMFKNVGGRRFSEITGSSGTGHLQKGHAVACGDWDRDGDVDVFIEMGGAVNGDRYHNILFQNPGQGNHWLTIKLVGQRTNRAAIGARIKVVTAGDRPLTIHRHISSGSSFGANPMQQTIGLSKAERIAELGIHWPTSGTTQVFRDIAADQAIQITEFADSYRRLDWKPIPQPQE